MGSMAMTPQPISRKAPKDSSRVTRQVRTVPGERDSKKGHGLFLGFPAAEIGDRGALCVGGKFCNCKAGLLADP